MAEMVLTVDNVSKKFCRDLKRSLIYGAKDIFSEVLGLQRHSKVLRYGEFWAVKNVGLELKRGDALGLVGPNGSGKTTLLKMISGLYKPDTGTIRVNGQVAPLLALGAGFNPVLTGRENIYVNMSILGLSKKQIESRFDQVVEFSELADAIDAPVQTYSSGMYTRLGFACAVHTDPEILLIDEVLSVGDMRFRAKCYRKLAELRKRDTSFIVVSHNPNVILSICNHAVYLLRGKQIMSGHPDQVMRKYEADLLGVDSASGSSVVIPERSTSTGLQITTISFRDAHGAAVDAPTSGDPGSLVVRCKVTRRLENVYLSLLVGEMDAHGDWMLNLSGERDDRVVDLDPGEFELKLQVPYWGLRPGAYTAKIMVSQPNFNLLDAVESFKFQVRSKTSMGQNSFFQPRDWDMVKLS